MSDRLRNSGNPPLTEPPAHVPTGYRCVVCGQPIEAEAEPIAGVYGKGYRHADYSICMANAEGDPYA